MDVDHHTWRTVDQLVAWLDAHSEHDPQGRPLQRILKLSEEVGEVAAAVIGASQANPRKPGRSWHEVEAELCDVALTALIALRTLTPDAPRVFHDHVAHVVARALGTGGTPPQPATDGTAFREETSGRSHACDPSNGATPAP